MSYIKAIETQYKGYRFRSRLEARWAVFFDALGVTWQYEPEGFDLGELGMYLPDFFLPVHGHEKYGETGRYIEIKGERPNQQYCDMLSRFACKVHRCVHVFVGDPGDFQEFVAHPNGSAWWPYETRLEFAPDCDPRFKALLQRLERDYDAYASQLGVRAWKFITLDGTFDFPHCLEAIDAARSARWEHGEQPVLPRPMEV